MAGTIDKHQFKITVATAIIVLIFIISAVATFATWKADMNAQHNEFDDRITHVGDKVFDMRATLETLEDQADLRDIQLAQINTKLANIESLLIEIKQDLRESR